MNFNENKSHLVKNIKKKCDFNRKKLDRRSKTAYNGHINYEKHEF
jgi:hypothetical protein